MVVAHRDMRDTQLFLCLSNLKLPESLFFLFFLFSLSLSTHFRKGSSHTTHCPPSLSLSTVVVSALFSFFLFHSAKANRSKAYQRSDFCEDALSLSLSHKPRNCLAIDGREDEHKWECQRRGTFGE